MLCEEEDELFQVQLVCGCEQFSQGWLALPALRRSGRVCVITHTTTIATRLESVLKRERYASHVLLAFKLTEARPYSSVLVSHTVCMLCRVNRDRTKHLPYLHRNGWGEPPARRRGVGGLVTRCWGDPLSPSLAGQASTVLRTGEA